jgi:aspartyl protease family protein
MARIIALLLTFAFACTARADVALVGLIGDKAAVLAVHGGEPKTVRVGQKWNGVTVIAVERGQAVVEVDGKRRTLTIGQHYRAVNPRDDRQSVTLAADPRGHFFTEGAVNGNAVRFLVDTGATTVALPAADAVRLGLDYRKGRPAFTHTAAGVVPVYVLTLDTVRLGAIELNSVEATVIERGLDVALLGMSFLNRVQMTRDGHLMTLTRRF